ncbi:HHL190Cp [Eremothecium sinecaudum]|uniref:HHL190Cp n=1 Tax=Eremothecium sinecaudum TaxID=45286 RepID=A0A0X8HWA2_9SACH|nr:HHL190Cp [Eremothecium sinecaudum]AMD22580.1 HHL190Cp [Eremothecium sinecaudum]
MSQLLENLDTEFKRFYDGDDIRNHVLKKCLTETHEFKLQLKKLKAHLNKQQQELQSGKVEDEASFNKKRQLISEKLRKTHNAWDANIRKSCKAAIVQQNRFEKHAVSKLFDFELEKVYTNRLPPHAKEYVASAIGKHLARYNISNVPMRERAEIVNYMKTLYGVDEHITEEYVEMGQIIQDLKSGSLESCMKWCTPGSNLQFELYLLKAKQLLLSGDKLLSYNYVMENIPDMMIKTRKYCIRRDIGALLGKIVVGGEERFHLLEEEIKAQLEKCIALFTKDYCKANNLLYDSSLFLILLSGIISFQFFIKYQTIRAASHVDWSTEDELPFHVKLPDFVCNFHPVFICPVLKEETTIENPPYSLPCHHIISKKSLDKLSTNGTCNFKCPYCPIMASKAKTKKVNFARL